MRLKSVVVLAVFLFTSCGGDSGGSAVRLEIVPANTLLLAGESSELKVVGYDADDKQVSVEATWSSDAAAVISVNGGSISDQAGMGSATISATAGDLTATAFVYVAEPVPGAVLFTDDQVVSEVVGTLDNGELVGSQFQLGLRGVDVSPGDIIISRGDTPAMGLVTDVNGETVTVEIIPLDQVFFNLDVAQEFEKVWDDPAELEALNVPDGASAAHRALDCTFSASATVTPSFPTPTARPVVAWDGAVRIVDGSFELVRLATRVGAILEVDGNFELPALFTGGFDCEQILWRLPIEGVGYPMGLMRMALTTQ